MQSPRIGLSMVRALPAVWFALALASAGCGKKRDATSAPVPKPMADLPAPGEAAAAPAAAALPTSSAGAGQLPASFEGCRVTPEPLRAPGGERLKRIIAIGDIHGDFAAVEAALRAVGAVDAKGAWIGGELVVVQTGDILDRGDDEQRIIDWMERLEGEAKAAGGALHWLLGNHELMNAAGDFRYVTDGGYRDFEDVGGLDRMAVKQVPLPAQARAAAMLAQLAGPYAKIMAGQETVRIVGDTVFSHAGVLLDWVPRLERLNLENRCWLAGQLAGRGTSSLLDDSSPVWTRDWGYEPADCAKLGQVLAALGVKRMVVGHTPQLEGITSDCGGALWRIDVGMSAHYGGPIQVLEISGGAAKVVAAKRPAEPPAAEGKQASPKGKDSAPM